MLDWDLPLRTQWRSQSRSIGCGFVDFFPLVGFPVVFLAFFGGVGLAVTICLPARVFKVLALALVEGSLIDSSLGGWAETENGRDEVVQCLHSYKRDIRFQENKTNSIDQGALPGLFPPRYGRSTPARRSASLRCLETFLPGGSSDAPE
jgi:hypothetical protein